MLISENCVRQLHRRDDLLAPHLALLWGEGEGGATGPSRANHAPAAGAAGLDPGYFAHAQDDARARDGPSMPRFALSLMRAIIIASIWASTAAMQ